MRVEPFTFADQSGWQGFQTVAPNCIPPVCGSRLSCSGAKNAASASVFDICDLIEGSWFGDVCLHATCQAMSIPISRGAGRLAGTEYRNLKADETFNWAQK
jgi:hypothetical protein